MIGNKNDFNDAAGIFDAVTRPNKRVVMIKTIEQQDIQLVHTIRNGLIGKRTALANQTRGLLSERGIIIPKSINQRGVAIFAKACFGHPSPSKRQKLNATTNAFGAPDVLRTCHFATIIVNSMLAS